MRPFVASVTNVLARTRRAIGKNLGNAAAALRRAQLGNPVPSNLGNASTWYILAQRAGLPTGIVPQVGAVAVNQAGDHVSVVEQVNPDGSFWVSEMNAGGQVSITDSRHAGGWDRVDYRLVPSVGNLKFIY